MASPDPSPPTNSAATLLSPTNPTLHITTTPYTPPPPNTVVVKTHTIALNWFDVVTQHMASTVLPWLTYPSIPGSDVAGTVHAVGANVTRFRPGDRVLGHAMGVDKRSRGASEGAFQEYVVLREGLVCGVPEAMGWAEACAVPLTLSTAACGLFMRDFLALRHPGAEKGPRGGGGGDGGKKETLLVWGGSTSVGAGAVQMGVAAGYDVVATASPGNFELVKKMGAVAVFDYKSATAVRDICAFMEGKVGVGALAVGDGSTEACLGVVGSASWKGRKFVAQATLPTPRVMPPKGLEMVRFVARYLWFSVSNAVRAKVRGVGMKFVWGSDLVANEVGEAVYGEYLPAALREGMFVVRATPRVVGVGLEAIQEGLELVKERKVGSDKIVVTL